MDNHQRQSHHLPTFADSSLALADGLARHPVGWVHSFSAAGHAIGTRRGEYAYAGQLMLQGIPPYELAYNLKLPGTYFAYALGMAVFGQNVAGVHLTLLVVNSLTILFVFLLGRKLLA